jgi:hypothetical protein
MTYAAQAAAAYRSSQQLDQRPAAVLAAAHQELAGLLASAIAAYQRRALDEMCRANARAARLLWGLASAFRGGSPETDRLVADYLRLVDAFNRLQFDPAAIDELREALDWLRKLTRMFLMELSSS